MAGPTYRLQVAGVQPPRPVLLDRHNMVYRIRWGDPMLSQTLLAQVSIPCQDLLPQGFPRRAVIKLNNTRVTLSVIIFTLHIGSSLLSPCFVFRTVSLGRPHQVWATQLSTGPQRSHISSFPQNISAPGIPRRRISRILLQPQFNHSNRHICKPSTRQFAVIFQTTFRHFSDIFPSIFRQHFFDFPPERWDITIP